MLTNYSSHPDREKKHVSGTAGFSLIELLVVVAILAVLAAIAIPVFLNQKQKATKASLNSDLHNLIMEMEALRPNNTNDPYATATLYNDIVSTGGYRVTPGGNYNLFAVYPNCRLTGAPTPTAWTQSNGNYVIAATGQTGYRSGSWTAPRYYYDSATGTTMQYGAGGLTGITGSSGSWSSVAAGGCNQISDIKE